MSLAKRIQEETFNIVKILNDNNLYISGTHNELRKKTEEETEIKFYSDDDRSYFSLYLLNDKIQLSVFNVREKEVEITYVLGISLKRILEVVLEAKEFIEKNAKKMSAIERKNQLEYYKNQKKQINKKIKELKD